MSERPRRRRRPAARPACQRASRRAARDAGDQPSGRSLPADVTRRAALDALAILRDESPDTYRLVSDRLAASPAELTVEGERIGVRSAHGIAHLQGVAPAAPLLVASIDRAGDIQLIDGTITLEQLLERQRLHVRGHPDALLGFLSAARAFADACTRSAALQRSFERYRESIGALG